MKVIILLACVAFASAALVKREATTRSPLADLEKNAAEIQKTFSENLNTFVQSPQSQEFQKTLKEGSDSVLKQLSTLTASLQSALTDANGKAKEFLETSRASLAKTTSELQQQHPEVQQNVEQLKTKIEQAIFAATAEAQKTAQGIASAADSASQQLAPKVQAAYEDFLEHTKDLQKKLHEAANKP